jgi:hypothetical protein
MKTVTNWFSMIVLNAIYPLTIFLRLNARIVAPHAPATAGDGPPGHGRGPLRPLGYIGYVQGVSSRLPVPMIIVRANWLKLKLE